MPATKPSRPTPRAALISRNVDGKDDADIPRAMDDHAAAIGRIEGRLRDRAVVTATLAVGANRINHGLGKKPTGCTVTPTTANATWAWAMTDASATQIEITTVGISQTNAVVEVF